MATKKTPKTKTVNKSDFIRSQSPALSAAEVIAKAKAAGIKMSSVLVYKVRGRAKPKKSASKIPPIPATASSPAPKSKTAYILSVPQDTPAKEVVAQAKKAGIKLTESYVYNVRGAAKRQAPRGSASLSRPITTPSSAESLLKALAAEIGLGRAIEVLSGERARVAAVIGV